MASGFRNQPNDFTTRAIASNRQTEAFASVIFFRVCLNVVITLNTPKYLGRELNHGHCLSHIFLAMALTT